jgi:hypothetical protein
LVPYTGRTSRGVSSSILRLPMWSAPEATAANPSRG